MENKYQNYGVKVGSRTEDYKADRVGGVLPYEERQLDGNWEPFLPPGEWQKSDNGDSMSCVSFGHLNSIETQEKQQTGKQVNYSDRWIAKMSDTDRRGNYLYKVADTIREYGLVEESDYPAPPTYTWDKYHEEIPEPLLGQLKIKGRAWLEKWDVKYEWVAVDKESLKKHLKHAPLSVIIPGHMIIDIHNHENKDKIFDQYKPWIKEVPGSIYPSNLSHAMKILLTPKEKADPDELLVNIEYEEFGSKVLKLKKALNKLGWKVEPGDLYDDVLKEVVWKYQLANLNRFSWAWFWASFVYRGRVVDATTRESINNNLIKRT